MKVVNVKGVAVGLLHFLKFPCAQFARFLRDSLFRDIMFLDNTQ